MASDLLIQVFEKAQDNLDAFLQTHVNAAYTKTGAAAQVVAAVVVSSYLTASRANRVLLDLYPEDTTAVAPAAELVDVEREVSPGVFVRNRTMIAPGVGPHTGSVR